MQGETPWHEDGERGKKQEENSLWVYLSFSSPSFTLFFPPFLSFIFFPFLLNFYPYCVALIFATSTLLSVPFSSVLQLVSCSILYILVLCTPTSSSQCLLRHTCFDIFHVIIRAQKCLVVLQCRPTVCCITTALNFFLLCHFYVDDEKILQQKF